MSFGKDVKKFAKKFDLSVQEVVEAAATSMFTDIVEQTPRDTGRAAAAWNLTRDEISTRTPAPGTYSKGVSAGQLQVRSGGSKKSVWYISNNLKYIVPLSRGHSKQVPNGWIERIIYGWQKFIRDAAK